ILVSNCRPMRDAMSAHQNGSHWPANHTTGHQTISGSGNGCGQGTDCTGLLQECAKRCGRPLATGQWYGPGRQGDYWRDTQTLGKKRTNTILDDDQDQGTAQEQGHGNTAFFEQLKAGRKADGGKEYEEQIIAHRAVDAKHEQIAHITGQGY